MLFIPHEGTNELSFGQNRAAVRKTLGECSEFRRTPTDKQTTDMFSFCFAYYDADNALEALEFFDGELLWQGKNMVKLPLKKLLALARREDTGLTADADGFTSLVTGFGAYAPGGKTEAVIIFRDGYYGH